MESSKGAYKIFHSPDTDDLLLFWQLIRLDSLNGRKLLARGMDTEQLNLAALNGEPDICAVSAAILPQLEGRYALSPYGASIGRGFGPAVVSKRLKSATELSGAKVAVPGMTTTAALVFKKLAPEAELVTVPITPFHAVFEALNSGAVDAAVLIHEGQIAFNSFGCKRLTDLGSWWYSETQLPLPLGVNVVRIFPDSSETASLNLALQESVNYGLDNVTRILPEILRENPALTEKLPTIAEFERYLGMYANEDSRRLESDCVKALKLLLGCDLGPFNS